jgi:hypothetical protein
VTQKANFYNVDAMEQGIGRELAEGLSTRIFPGEQAMISIVRIGPDPHDIVQPGVTARRDRFDVLHFFLRAKLSGGR